MKKITIILFALLLVAGFAIITDTSSVFAQDDNEDNGEHEFDPITDNWCTNPDKWGDGRCNVEGDVWLTNWYYICGYYMARIESGIWPKGPEGQLVADGCLVPLPPPIPRVAAPGAAVAQAGFPVADGVCVVLKTDVGISTASLTGNFFPVDFVNLPAFLSLDCTINSTSLNFGGAPFAYAPGGIGDAKTICDSNLGGSHNPISSGGSPEFFFCN